jgi:hypothetical protein
MKSLPSLANPTLSPYEQMINEQKKQGAGIFFSLNIGS